jgi:ferric-dicitrate binding protein FerR (iron transport regulator)
MGPNHEIDFIYLLDRMLSGKLTEIEKQDLQTYIKNSYHDDSLNLLMRNHWLGLEDEDIVVDEMQLLILKNRINSGINQTINPVKKEYSLFPSTWKNYLMRAAAVLFIPILIGSLLLFYRMDKRIAQMAASSVIEKVVAHPGSRVHFTLPDQTEVWLNSGSMLEYPLAMNEQDSRKVKLSGQGYFKVAHDAAHPFFVETEELSIKALGTCFDVSVYADDELNRSTLEEGSIALIDRNGVEITRIHPGQQAILNKSTKTMVVKDVETLLTTSWKEGKLIFRKTPLSDVTTQLERWFNCKIHLDPRLLNIDLNYTATIQDETLGEVLKMIEISTRIKTKIEKREVYIESKN